MDLKLINFLHKLYDNKLPIYFNEYMPYLEARETKYDLRPHPLPVPRVTHAFAESCLLYTDMSTERKKKSEDCGSPTEASYPAGGLGGHCEPPQFF